MLKIALIEDDPEIRRMYQLKLVSAGYEVAEAENGLLGYSLLSTFKPSVVLLDVMMPQSGGVDFLDMMRRNPDFDHINVIIMTNLDDEALRRSMADFKVSDYLVKAETTPGQVVDKIKSLS